MSDQTLRPVPPMIFSPLGEEFLYRGFMLQVARCVLLFGGDRREHRDGIDLLPVGDALPDPAIVLE